MPGVDSQNGKLIWEYMTQEELWQMKYQEVVAFIKKNKRNPSKHSDEERGIIK